jgi:hypothetical protein
MCQCAVDLLSLPFDPTEFLMKHSGPVSEPISASRTTSIELGMVPIEVVYNTSSETIQEHPVEIR